MTGSGKSVRPITWLNFSKWLPRTLSKLPNKQSQQNWKGIHMVDRYLMIGYIHEGPEALHKTLVSNENMIHQIAQISRKRDIRRIIVTGLGSSYSAAMMAQPLMAYHIPHPTYVFQASELPYFQERLLDSNTLVIAVSRSGERGPVIDSLVAARERGALGVAITGTPGCLLCQHADHTLLTMEGAEITFPKTKSVLACAGLLMRLWLELASPEDREVIHRKETLLSLTQALASMIKKIDGEIQGLLPCLTLYENVVVLGSASNFGVALEAAIKLQEAAYLPTRGEYTISFIHGPSGALTKRFLVVPMVIQNDQSIAIELLKLVRKFGAGSLAIQAPGVDLEGWSNYSIQLGTSFDPFLDALGFLPAIQLLTYHWTVQRGMNPDAPSSMLSILDTILPPGREEPELRSKQKDTQP
jgi:glucosamine--fructose-6-phosphate aminotransferase (isomerizing)